MQNWMDSICWEQSWVMVTAVGTAIMALSIIISATIALSTWKRSISRSRHDVAYQLLTEFMTAHLNTFEELSEKDYKGDTNINEKNRKSYRLILFLSKLGFLLKNKKLTMEETDMFFRSFLFYRNSLNILIPNLAKFTKKLKKNIRDDINYLINEIIKYMEFKNLKKDYIYDKFGIRKTKD